MKTNFRAGFTLIEVLISVLIISTSIMYVLSIYSQNREQILYISEKGRASYSDSLFLTDKSLKLNKDKKNAYDSIYDYFKIKDSKSKEILKSISREFFIPDSIELRSDEENMPEVKINEIKIKDKFSSSYNHFAIDGL